MRPEHRFVQNAGEMVAVVDLVFFRDLTKFAVERQSDFGLEVFLPLLRHGHHDFSVSKLTHASKR